MSSKPSAEYTPKNYLAEYQFQHLSELRYDHIMLVLRNIEQKMDILIMEHPNVDFNTKRDICRFGK